MTPSNDCKQENTYSHTITQLRAMVREKKRQLKYTALLRELNQLRSQLVKDINHLAWKRFEEETKLTSVVMNSPEYKRLEIMKAELENETIEQSRSAARKVCA